MDELEKVIKGLEHCVKDCDCRGCVYAKESGRCQCRADAIALLKEQEAIIEQYRRADGFLNVHGWKWEDDK